MKKHSLEIKVLVSLLANIETSHLIKYLIHPTGYVHPIGHMFINESKPYNCKVLESQSTTIILDRVILHMGRSQ